MSNYSSFKDLEIYGDSLDLFYKVHAFSLRMPKYEMYELGSQLRRSADSTITNIVEGYGRRKYKNDYVRFLVYAHSSALETKLHLEKIGHLYTDMNEDSRLLREAYEKLSIRIFSFLKYVETNWKT